jgi:DNA-binding transcriptional ArsR family regulator
MQPHLSPARPIRKGKGGLPRILSLAAERAKAWYRHPQKCHALNRGKRQVRSERREAYQVVIETILSLLDLASLCLGTPTLDNGFVDVDMRTLVAVAGIGQRRIERAIADLKEAGLMEVKQPRKLNEYGEYVGLRAIRVIRESFFEFLNLGPMLRQERARATERLRRKAMRVNRKLTDLMRRVSQGIKSMCKRPVVLSQTDREKRESENRRWNQACAQYIRAGLEPMECRRRTNEELDLPAGYSSGRRT